MMKNDECWEITTTGTTTTAYYPVCDRCGNFYYGNYCSCQYWVYPQWVIEGQEIEITINKKKIKIKGKDLKIEVQDEE